MLSRYQILNSLFIFVCLLCRAQASPPTSGLFDSDEVLILQISGNIKELFKERGEASSYHPFQLSYVGSDSNRVSIPIQIKTRGHFRKSKENCTYPPLMLNFSKEATPPNSLFSKQNKMKLVTPCREEKYVVREYLVYKLSNLMSPKSFRARLVKVVYEDSEKGKKTESLFGILLEEEGQMAKRNNASLVEGKMIRSEQTQIEDFHKMAVFEYLIGNTDWSVQYYQNVKLIAADAGALPSTVPYDFDHAGIVDAPYALPAPELLMTSTRERRYRGYCLTDLASLNATFTFFNSIKEEIYNTYTKNTLLEPSYIKATTKFLDDFYKILSTPKSVQREFGYPCLKEGTGNVVIQGLKKK